MGRDLINLFFLKDVSRRSLVFFLAPRARSRASRSLSRACFVRALADVLKRRKRKIKQCLCTDYSKRRYKIFICSFILGELESFRNYELVFSRKF